MDRKEGVGMVEAIAMGCIGWYISKNRSTPYASAIISSPPSADYGELSSFLVIQFSIPTAGPRT
jgi:hypothetical protein